MCCFRIGSFYRRLKNFTERSQNRMLVPLRGYLKISEHHGPFYMGLPPPGGGQGWRIGLNVNVQEIKLSMNKSLGVSSPFISCNIPLE